MGSVRQVRSDDWAVALPLALSERAQEPRFPVKNDLVGLGGADGRVGYPVPIRSWLTAFRPQIWGYFIGDDFGLAWHWWSRALGLAWAFWAVFTLVGAGRAGSALAGALALVFQPFFQYWSFTSEPIAASAALGFVAALGVVTAGGTAGIFLHGVLLAWAAGCFALGQIYPPFQIPIAWLFVAVAAGWAWRERGRLAGVSRWPLRIVVLAAAVLCAAALVALWAFECREPLRLLAETVYPGRRRVTGGDVLPATLLNAFQTQFLRTEGFSPLGNVCEAASFLFLSPAILLFEALEAAMRRRRPDPVVLALGGYSVVIALHATVGLPGFLARATLFDRVAGGRSIVGLGIAGLLMTVAFVARRGERDGIGVASRALAVAAAWAGTVLVSGIVLRERMPALAPWMPVAGALVAFLATLAVLLRNRVALPLLAAISIAGTAWFNPLVLGGSDYLRDNPLSQRILALDRAAGGGSRWIVYEDWIPNLLRAIGVHSVGGLQYLPQRELWARLDPENAANDAHNRYAHIIFVLPRGEGEPRIFVPYLDTVVVELSPESAAFARLGVDYVLITGKGGDALDRSRTLVRVGQVADKHLFRVVR